VNKRCLLLSSINTGNAVNYQWFVNGNTVGTNSNKFTTNSLVNGDVVTVGISTSASCLTTNTATSNAITMTVNSVSFTIPNVEYCNGKSATVDLNIPLTNYSVFWKNGTDTITTNNDILTVNNTTNASLQFTVKFGIGCTKSGVVPIKVNQLPFINATVDIADAKYEEVVQLSANGNSITQYNWLPASSVSEDSIKNPTAIITATTVFTVNVKDANQCENSDTVLVRLINECLNEFIYLPTAFSPNRDGVNDCFGIISPPKLTDFKMTIFNRWGEKVFESSDKDNCWDGMYKGVEALSDSYVYLIGFKCYDGLISNWIIPIINPKTPPITSINVNSLAVISNKSCSSFSSEKLATLFRTNCWISNFSSILSIEEPITVGRFFSISSTIVLCIL
jgi:gliding motility-associated-like protein